jgi:hypothetical protein
MNILDIFVDPKTASELDARRAALEAGSDTAMLATLWCPIPVVDVIVGVAVEAAERSFNAPELEGLRPVSGGFDLNWAACPAAADYVAKVKDQGRDLTVEEVRCLSDYAKAQRATVDMARSVMMGALRGIRPGGDSEFV